MTGGLIVDNIMQEYLRITGGFIPDIYLGPEEQAKRIVKCSILKDTNLEYTNFTAETKHTSKK